MGLRLPSVLARSEVDCRVKLLDRNSLGNVCGFAVFVDYNSTSSPVIIDN